jgi:hypothetical protein
MHYRLCLALISSPTQASISEGISGFGLNKKSGALRLLIIRTFVGMRCIRNSHSSLFSVVLFVGVTRTGLTVRRRYPAGRTGWLAVERRGNPDGIGYRSSKDHSKMQMLQTELRSSGVLCTALTPWQLRRLVFAYLSRGKDFRTSCFGLLHRSISNHQKGLT